MSSLSLEEARETYSFEEIAAEQEEIQKIIHLHVANPAMYIYQVVKDWKLHQSMQLVMDLQLDIYHMMCQEVWLQ